jgi:hypothetical protein
MCWRYAQAVGSCFASVKPGSNPSPVKKKKKKKKKSDPTVP